MARILSEDRAVTLRRGPEGAVLSVKTPETFAFGETVDARWIRRRPRTRARAVLGWIRRAAVESRAPRIRYLPDAQTAA